MPLSKQDRKICETIVGAFMEKCDMVNPDGSTHEDYERDLIEPFATALRLAREEGATQPDVFTPTQVKCLDAYQRAGMMHPFTCGNRGDGNHFQNGNDVGVLTPTVKGWICQCCDYRQNWAHDFMLTFDADAQTAAIRALPITGEGA